MSILPSGIERPFGVLFVCNDNSRSSLVAEALFRDNAPPDIRCFSAGMEPADAADPFILSSLTLAGLGSDGLWPKHWMGFSGRDGQIIDLIVQIGDLRTAFMPRAFVGEPEMIKWPSQFQEQPPTQHRGVWQEIQEFRPRIQMLLEDIGAMREFSVAPSAYQPAE